MATEVENRKARPEEKDEKTKKQASEEQKSLPWRALGGGLATAVHGGLRASGVHDLHRRRQPTGMSKRESDDIERERERERERDERR